MADDAASEPRVNLFVFSVLCFVVAFAWDVTCVLVVPKRFEVPWQLVLWVAPTLLCAGMGVLLGQWRAGRSGVVKAGAALWCVVTPVVVFAPFMVFICWAFAACLT